MSRRAEKESPIVLLLGRLLQTTMCDSKMTGTCREDHRPQVASLQRCCLPETMGPWWVVRTQNGVLKLLDEVTKWIS
ncbi:unnamed protein product [Boreogadus saida]